MRDARWFRSDGGFGRWSPRAVLMALAAWLVAPALSSADDNETERILTGEQIYRQQCAWCHGERGQGTEINYPKPLIGDRSVPQLAKIIEETMPNDDPALCEGAEAERVAEYIYDAFYSPIAQARNAPPEIAFSRLTVRQHKNALTDLVGSFRSPQAWDFERRGLDATYAEGRRIRKKDVVLERIDPVIDFDFGIHAPSLKFEDANRFAIRWEGALMAPETGTYEFVVQSQHSVRLWVNETDRAAPLIDGWVQSGDMTEHEGSITLLEGRPYPIRLEFSKANQGVNNEDKENPEIPATIRLFWTPPGGVKRIVPARFLAPVRTPKVFVAETPFPPDDRSEGYERGVSVSSAWKQAVIDAAIETADDVVENLDELADARNTEGETRVEKLKVFCRKFAERAFRRPLSEDVQATYIDQQFAEAPHPDEAVKRVVMLVLSSPRFLYVETDRKLDAYDVATRLALGLWDSIPDDRLLEAAATGRLANADQVREQATRMLDDPRTRSKLRAFFHQWLLVEHAEELGKDSELYPEFDKTVVEDLHASLDLFLEAVAWGDDPDFRRLLLAEEVPVNDRLADLYGIERPESREAKRAKAAFADLRAAFGLYFQAVALGNQLDLRRLLLAARVPLDARLADLYGLESPEEAGKRAEQFQPIALEPEHRSGVLTHPFVLANLAYTDTSSPIHRGVFLVRGVLGRTLKPPPEAFSPIPADLHPDLTTRERVTLQTKPASCMSCHGMINPLGFSLEHFDAIGRFREQEYGKPIDASGLDIDPYGDEIRFNGAKELAAYLAESEEVHEAFAEQLFQYLTKQPAQAYGPDTLETLRDRFAERNYHIRKLMVEIMALSALKPRNEPPVPEEAAEEAE